MEDLYHYYDASTGPFRNLSDLTVEEAETVQSELRLRKKGFASKRGDDYLEVRRGLEALTRKLFVAKGGRPVRQFPHYMTLGSCPWLLEWYPQGRLLQIPFTAFQPDTISFTYGDLFPTMRLQDGKPYRGQVYTAAEIETVIRKFGLPQVWNRTGAHGPERYIEVQVWDDSPLPSFAGMPVREF
ncbi:hypothetical protein [Paenibacillus donghaensis]|uniref:Uncharacterized protein n=1 Tax=Paenibacillus donghaensis TaxID=414771 RepID=A0A2Z2KPW4_9BACL|nr:hypothetical protein [Paenibacillus donghaensis]ASA26605.1 hypothetical protein B9T62_35045 [Paenibacillus donghaensis]